MAAFCSRTGIATILGLHFRLSGEREMLLRYGDLQEIPGPVVLFVLGATALLVGMLVYLLDRPPGSVAFLPSALVDDSGVFGVSAGWLPTVLHTLAFALMTAALFAPTVPAQFAACALWLAVNLLFEAAQHPGFVKFTGVGRPGVFDPMDILAALLGAAGAFLLMRTLAPPKAPRT